MMYTLDDTSALSAKIKVIGVGGGGGNALNNMIDQQLRGVDFIVANTDAQAIEQSKADTTLQLGTGITRGLGAGANPQVGREAADAERDHLREFLTDTDMVFITAGMGGGTGTGAAPIIAQVAHEMGVLTVAVVTKPFEFEGPKRMRHADAGIEELRQHVDTLITIPNQKLINAVGKNTSMLDAFRKADDVLLQAVKGISELITHHGYMNVDFADVKAVMSETSGMAMMGSGVASGESRACEAAERAIHSPLLEDIDIHGAQGILVNVTASSELGMHEYSEAVSIIQNMADENANVICGLVYDESMEEDIRVTVVATGLNADSAPRLATTSSMTAPAPVQIPLPSGNTFASADPVNNFDQYDRPTVTRQNDNTATALAYDEENLAVPTWIRRQAD
ncbi:MAG: cell division protein FtsZ [Mariprofundaceae bacterium]